MNFKQYLINNGYNSLIYAKVISSLNKKVNINNIENITNYLMKNKNNYAEEYINLHIKALKLFYKYKGINAELPKLRKVDNKIPESITEEYFLKTIIPMIDREMFLKPLRVKALLFFLFYTGVRKSELLTLKRKDIDLKQKTAKIYGKKTKKERLVVFTNKTKEILIEYFDKEPEKINSFNLGKYSLNEICSKLKPYFPDINLKPHLFRSSFATHLLSKGVDVTIVSKLLGHSNLQTTMRYLNTNIDLISNIYKKQVG